MLLNTLKPLNEASYPGNIGMMEMLKFYNVASDTQKSKMRELLTKKLYDEAWELLQSVTGIELQPS